MILIKQSESAAARRGVFFFCSDDDSADQYAAKTGLTFSASELKVRKAGGVEANSAGSAVEIGGGWYFYTFTAAEIDTLGLVSVRVEKTDVYSELAIAQVVSFDPYNGTNLGLANVDVTTSSRLAGASYQNLDALLDQASTIETGLNLRGFFRLAASVLFGELSGAGTGTETFRNAVQDSKARVTAVVDTSGNRTSITTDQT